jgi:hypothetical protein
VTNQKAIRVLVVALIVFTVFVVHALVQRRDAVRHAQCVRTLLAIEGAKEQYAIEHGGEAPASIDVLVPRYLPEAPVCPSGGSYVLGDLQTGVVCSIAAHIHEWP